MAELDLIKIKFAQEPAEDPLLTTTIMFRVPSGQRVSRRFLKDEPVKVLYDYMRKIASDQANGFENQNGGF